MREPLSSPPLPHHDDRWPQSNAGWLLSPASAQAASVFLWIARHDTQLIPFPFLTPQELRM